MKSTLHDLSDCTFFIYSETLWVKLDEDTKLDCCYVRKMSDENGVYVDQEACALARETVVQTIFPNNRR